MSNQNRRGWGVVIPLALAATLCVGTLPAQAATTNPNPSSRETAHAKLSRRAATEGMVLLDNTGGALPIADNGNVALFGVGAYATVKGGTGSGSVNNRATVDVRTGLEKAGYKVTTSPVYYDAMVDAVDNASGSGGIFGSIDYASLEQALTSTTVQPTAATDTALFIVARNSGEGSDRSASKGDFYLNDIEAANLRLLGQTYSKVVVVLNTGGIVDTEFFKDINADVQDPNGGQALDSLFLMSQAGQESGHALVDVLSGDVTPSGKLTDSWAANYDYYPASETFAGNDGDTLHEEYSEGIYVGYRYFDSFYKTLSSDPATVVNYPFGFGLSYTDFKIDPGKVTVSDGRINVAAKVTNTGTKASGKEVVQVYFSAPQSGLDKPYQELAGYAKTDNLAPGQSQSVTVSFDIFELSSYDEATAAYVVEKGDYVIRVGNSSRNTAVAAVLPVSTTKVVEQLTNQYNDVAPATELVSDPADFYSYADEAEQIAAAPRVTLPSSAIPFEDNSSPFDQDVAVGTDSPYYDIDKSPISSVDVYLDPDQDDWEGTGGAYPTKTGENVVATETNPEWTLYDVYRGTVTMQEFVASRRLEELANIVEGTPSGGSITSVVGAAGYTTSRYEDLGIAGMSLVDGPAGVRVTNTLATNPVSYQWATAFPIGTLLAQTFDRALVEEVGEAVGDEMAEFEATVWLAPSFNLHRDPLNGRNFEYLSEDPLASGLVAAALTEGVQSVPGRGVSVKHFAANNQESDRNTTDSIIGERALREMYLRGFEIVVKQAQPMTVMSSYNKINNTYTAGDYDLLTDLLRGEWGFKGLVMTDWGGIRAGAVNTMYAGNDLITPGNNPEEMINASLKNTPRIDVNGLPVHRQIEQLMGTFLWVQHRWGFNSLIPSATGTETVATTVDATTDLSQVPASVVVTADAINNEVVTHRDPYTSVNEAYEEVATILDAAGDSWGATMTSAEAAGVTLSGIVREDPADDSSPVVSYTVTVRGDYPAAGYTMRLGDLQRSAANVLNVVMHSAPFEHLADANGVSGINVGPYADQFDNLHEFMVTGLGKVTDPETKPSPMPQPTVTVTARPEIGFTPQRPYEVPGYHEINGRRWYTECEYYSQTVRCRTNIWSTVVRYEAGGKFVTETGWHFNNLTYLPYMKRAQWADNPLGKTGTFTSSGRNWRTECDTAATGRGACRSYAWVTNVVETRKDSAGATRYVPVSKWVFNNIVRFRAN